MTAEQEAAVKRRKDHRRKKPINVTHLPGLGGALLALHDAKKVLEERQAKAQLSIEGQEKGSESRTPDSQQELSFK